MDTSKATTERVPEVSVVIPHYNDPERLGLCLCELMENDTGGVEIIVVDNGSTVPIDAVRERFPAVRFLIETEKGAAPARNRGVSAARGEILAFIDADCVPARDWLAAVRRVASRADLVGGRVSVFDETPPPRTGAQAFEAVFAFDFRTYIEKKGFSGAGNLVTTRAVFEDVGPFVNGLSEDTEWTKRAVAKGYRLVYDDGLRVGHPSRSDWPALRAKWRRLTEEAHALERAEGRPRRRWLAKALMMPASILAHLPRVLSHRDLRSPGERWRAALTLARLRLLRMRWMLRQAFGMPSD
ncbi:glycosyltransferase family 2 protein [Rhodosalinus sp. K401]|uniref:glycosyltransferase family 2 protein n=1 Tax=Rhodosalinus sp. K401 TaxID=3239195 RepID=UPI0035257685